MVIAMADNLKSKNATIRLELETSSMTYMEAEVALAKNIC